MKILQLLLLILLFSVQASVDAKLYKWVDEDGRVHYSDKVPPEQIDQAREELNKVGVVKERVDRALTPEERAIQAEVLKKQRDEEQRLEKLKKEKEHERNTLLKSYSDPEQIIRLKQERIDALKRNIELAEENLIIQNRNLEDLLKRAADRERSGDVVSEVFISQIEKTREQIAHQKQFIIDKTEEITTTKEKYDYELAKYLEYSGQTLDPTIIKQVEEAEAEQKEQADNVDSKN